MRLIINETAAWICVLLGAGIQTAALAWRLKEQNRLKAARAWALLLPAAAGLLAAKGGFEALQTQESYAQFRWCYTCGLLGMMAGTALCARISGVSPLRTLDGTAVSLCAAMAAARLAQRWLGETGMGPILDSPGLFAMVNDWDEPVLATFLIEVLVCLLAGLGTWIWKRRKERAEGNSLCLALLLMMIPQILTEQFRSGEYLRFMMMRLEQALYALVSLGTLIYLCRKAAVLRLRGWKSWLPAAVFTALAGVIALVQFMLDGKVADCPAEICWTLYALAIAGMLAAGWAAVHGAETAERKGKTE